MLKLPRENQIKKYNLQMLIYVWRLVNIVLYQSINYIHKASTPKYFQNIEMQNKDKMQN